MIDTRIKTKERAVNKFMQSVSLRNPYEPEFLQAVKEVTEVILPYTYEHSEYNKADILNRLTEPERVVMFKVPWIDDTGRYRFNRGYRVQMNSAIGPYKGGLRFHPSVNLSILKFLGFEQTLKNALTSLPMGGAKGGSDFDPKGKSDNEIMLFCQSFMTELAKFLGPDIDVPAGDIGVGAREIGFLFGQYKRLTSEFSGVLTGKGLTYGGSYIRPEATGYGLGYFVEEMLNKRNDSLRGKKVLISGSGNVAQYAIEKVLHFGGVPVTASDSDGFIYDPQGITAEKIAYLKELKNDRRGRIREYADKYNVLYAEGQKPWGVVADVALPCATQNEVTQADAQKLVNNGIILLAEGANMPTTPEAIALLQSAQVLYAPGKASNAGGVATSGLEMSQNAMHLTWPKEEVDARLKNIMQDIHRQCVRYGQTGGQINYLLGANLAGFIKVADAMIAQGNV